MKVKSSKNNIRASASSIVNNRGIEPSPKFPFPEWSDQDIGQENWNDIGKHEKTTDTSSVIPRNRSRDQRLVESKTAVNEDPRFEDKQVVNLPYSIVAYKWKPAAKVFFYASPVVYLDKTDYPNLIVGSKHLLHSEFVRSFISSIHMLTYLGNSAQFDIEYTSSNFTPTTAGMPWKPWHHIYSVQSSTTKHDPVINQIGKYVVRLFWMGAWRKIYVDDQLPVDMLNHVMLPSLVKPNEEYENRYVTKMSRAKIKIEFEEKIVELWPFLLAKALLKIASLSWYKDREIIDFDIVQCLTGWTPQKINTRDLPISEIWKMCWDYTNHFKWKSEEPETSPSSKNKKVPQIEKKQENLTEENLIPCHLVAHCKDLRDFEEEGEFDFYPCWSHQFLIDQTRNIPLLKPTITADLDFWKRLRWLKWAVEKGMVPGEELLPYIMSFKVVSPFKKVSAHIVYRQPSSISIETDVFESLYQEQESPKVTQDKKEKKEKKEKGNEEGSPKESKKSNTTKTSKGKGTNVDIRPVAPDPSFWVNHEEVSPHINMVTVYFKPSTFKTKIVITDLDLKQYKGKKEDALDTNVLIYPLDLQKFRNEPLYIYTESNDDKLIILKFSQVGYPALLYREKKMEKSVVVPERYTECDFCLASLVKRVRQNITAEEYYVPGIPASKLEQKLVIYDRTCANIVLEEYNWKTDKLGNTVASINTYGSKTTTLAFGPGRKVFKLWIKCHISYILHIFSDTRIVIGSLETILSCMSQESKLFEDKCTHISNSFGELIESFCKPEFPLTLKSFYSSYKPQTVLTKNNSNLVHDTFFDLLTELVGVCLTKKEIYALKILFFKWQNPPNLNYEEYYDLCNCYDEDDFKYLKAMENCVLKIQAYHRGCYERALMKRHDKSHRDYTTLSQSLFHIYSAIFSVDNRFTNCNNLIRAFLTHPDMEEIKESYSDILPELENVLTLKEITGNIKVSESFWALICRQLFFVYSKDPVIVRINLFCDTNQYVVRVMDNDTNKEFKRYTNNVAVTAYKSNSKGYTVICYAWSPSAKYIRYKLVFATKKEVECDKVYIPKTNMEINQFSGIYSPNINNIICKYLVELRSEQASLSIYFASCYRKAIVNLKLYDAQDNVLQNITGDGYLVLPAFVIKYPKETGDFIMALSADGKGKKRSRANKSIVSVYETDTRKSVDGHKTSRFQIPPYYQRSESRDIKRNLVTTEPAVYRIEVSVVDDSWPLKADEWSNVEGLTSEEPKPQVKEVKEQIPFGQSSFSLKRLSQVLEKPYWIMHTVHNSGEAIDIFKDTRRENKLKEMKSKWCEEDPQRAEKAKQLRRKFLEENEIANTEIEDKPYVRSLLKDDFALKILPPLNLPLYMIKSPDEVHDQRKVKDDEGLKMDYQREAALMEEAENQYNKSVEKINDFTDKQIENLNIMNSWFNDIRNESDQMMAGAMELKKSYMDAVLQTRKTNEKTGNKHDKEKKGKKDKKG